MIERKQYIDALIKKEWNGKIKVITGIRRCGKSTILFNLFRDYLIENETDDNHIIGIDLETNKFSAMRDPDILAEYLREKIINPGERYYVLIDEIQYAISSKEMKDKDNPVRIYGVLNELVKMKNVDVYVTGSNSKLLSKDIATEFRGRGDVIHVYPLSYSEFYAEYYKNKEKNVITEGKNYFQLTLKTGNAYDEYAMFGGMPELLQYDTDQEKQEYLTNLFEEIYFKDIEERYRVDLPTILRDLTSILCSNIGALTNDSKIARTIKSTKGVDVNSDTIGSYIEHLEESFLFSEAKRYDVKGKKYLSYPSKYYCTDVGLRNARLGFRQVEGTHIMENVIYNELLIRGYLVDVGIVPIRETEADKKVHQKNVEVDFIARKGSKIYYIQSAFSMDDKEKGKTEIRPLIAIKDSFKKIVVSKSYGKSWTDENGILRIGIEEFLLNKDSLDM